MATHKHDDFIENLVESALSEDIRDGDITASLIPASTKAHARVISRQTAILCGEAWFEAVFRQLDESILVVWKVHDGDPIQPYQVVCELSGPARTLLTGERTALNF